MGKNSLFAFIIILLLSTNFKAQSDRLNSASTEQFMTSGISVTIGGSFIVTGTFQASPMERIDNLVTRIYNSAKVPYLSQVRDLRTFNQINTR